MYGTTIGVIKGDAGSLDSSSDELVKLLLPKETELHDLWVRVKGVSGSA